MTFYQSLLKISVLSFRIRERWFFHKLCRILFLAHWAPPILFKHSVVSFYIFNKPNVFLVSFSKVRNRVFITFELLYKIGLYISTSRINKVSPNTDVWTLNLKGTSFVIFVCEEISI